MTRNPGLLGNRNFRLYHDTTIRNTRQMKMNGTEDGKHGVRERKSNKKIEMGRVSERLTHDEDGADGAI